MLEITATAVAGRVFSLLFPPSRETGKLLKKWETKKKKETRIFWTEEAKYKQRSVTYIRFFSFSVGAKPSLVREKYSPSFRVEINLHFPHQTALGPRFKFRTRRDIIFRLFCLAVVSTACIQTDTFNCKLG